MMDWIATTWQSFIDWLVEVFNALMDFIKDVFLDVFELLMSGVVYIFSLIQPPDFLSQGIGVLFNSLHPDILYFLSMSGLDSGLAVYGTGVVFRLTRKLFTLGQW
tara:strand:- start:2593 stop:2907 length:315 start_codon:yes stop_codon:yes gene_type:complete